MQAAQIQRQWNVEDRDEERTYDRIQLDEARDYNRQELNEARAYDEKRMRELIPNMVTDAEKAGFNPLTLLRSGGASSYGAGSGFAPLSSGSLTSSVTRRQAPVRQAVGGSPVAAGIESFGNFIANFDPHRDNMREQEAELINAQIRNLNMQSSTYVGRTFAGPVRGAGVISSKKPGKLSGEKDDDIRDIYTKWRDRDGKIHWIPNPDLPDADQLIVPSLGIVTSEGYEYVKGKKPTYSAKPIAGRGGGGW
jgi:hypothetical protein